MSKVKVRNDDVSIFTPDELRTLLHAAPPHLIPILAIGAFSGIRMAELNRLDWSAVDLDRGHHRAAGRSGEDGVPPDHPDHRQPAGVDRAAAAQGQGGADHELHREVTALARALKMEWPRNVLRHSFISYRIAKVKSADQVALEAGNSPSIIFKHYRELTTEEQADEWFGILPKEGQWENTFKWDRRARVVTLPESDEE